MWQRSHFSIKGEGHFLLARLFSDDTPSKMKFLIVVALAVACAHADVSHVVQGGDAGAAILKYDSEVNPESFNYVYETSNGIYAASKGVVKNANSENAAQEVTGEFKYTGPDGVNYQVTYIADENGYQPQGAHLPVPPEVPELIARSLAYNAAHPQAEDKYVAPAAVASASASASAFGNNKPFNKPNRRF